MKKSLLYTFYLAMLSPVLALLYSMKARSTIVKKSLLIFLITLYGATISFAPGADGERHQARVDNYVDMSFSEYLQGAYDILQIKRAPSGAQDLYIYTLSYFSGGILGLPSIFFTLVALIYAIFYTNSIIKVTKQASARLNDLPVWYYIFLFFLIINISVEGINTVRTYTGLYVGFFGVISYLQTRNRNYLFFVFATPLIHFGYFIMVIPIVIGTLLGTKFINFYILAFAISFFVSLDVDLVSSRVDRTELGEQKFHGYYKEDTSEVYQLSSDKKGRWYASLGKQGLEMVAVKFLAVSFVVLGIYKKMSPIAKHLFCIGILLITWANLLDFIPAVHFRTMSNASVYVLAATVLLLSRPLKTYQYRNMKLSLTNLVLLGFTLMFSIRVLYQIAYLTYNTSVFMLAIPVLPWLDEEINMSIREFITWLFSI